jgi:hypothetical protein
MARKAPESVNYLKNNGFKFEINKIPNVNFYIQEANIPSVGVDYMKLNHICSICNYANRRKNYIWFIDPFFYS